MGGTTSREGQTFVGESLLVRYVNFFKLPHTVFALPFALLGLVVASRETALTWRTLGLVVLAFTCARFVALGFNRIADRELDARNPRTRARELPSGRLTLRQAWVAVVVAAVVFLATAWALNPLCFALAPLALVFISACSYAKRFTHWSHLWLGLADGIATPAGYLAVTGRWSEPWWLLPVGALAVTFWVGGFDVFYALQDEAFDRSERLASLVVRLGQAGAILAAKLLHGLALIALVLFGMGAGLGVAPYGVRLLEMLAVHHVPTWLLVSSHGWRLLTEECGITDDRALKQATGGEWTSVRVFDDTDRGAEPASGSAKTAGMVICPCSMGTVAAIAHGTSRSLIERAADVVLKERRRLILVPRETPLSLVHLRNLTLATEAGAVVLPAAPGFYHKPQLVRDLVDFVVQRVLDHLGLDINLVKRWEGK